MLYRDRIPPSERQSQKLEITILYSDVIRIPVIPVILKSVMKTSIALDQPFPFHCDQTTIHDLNNCQRLSCLVDDSFFQGLERHYLI